MFSLLGSLFFPPLLPLNGTGGLSSKKQSCASGIRPVLAIFFFFIPHMSTSPKSGAPSEKIYAVRCDLVRNPISVFAVGAQTATVGWVKPLITTFILVLALTGQTCCQWGYSDIELILILPRNPYGADCGLKTNKLLFKTIITLLRWRAVQSAEIASNTVICEQQSYTDFKMYPTRKNNL